MIIVHVRDARFRDDPNAVYCGRAAPRAADPRCHTAGLWANPYVVYGEESRLEALRQFRELVWMRLTVGGYRPAGSRPVRCPSAWWKQRLLELDGRVCACWCRNENGAGPGSPCHLDILAEYLAALKTGTSPEAVARATLDVRKGYI